MNISFDENTKEALQKALESRNKSAVRLMIDGFGWGGPSFGVALDEQKQDDEVKVIDDIKFVAEKDISFLFEDAKLLHRNGIFGSRFDVTTGRGSGSC